MNRAVYLTEGDDVAQDHAHHVTASVRMRGLTAAFIALVAASVFQCVQAHFSSFDAVVAAFFTTLLLGGFAIRQERRHPVAFAIGQDGVTTWNRAGEAEYRRIIGCAQWSDSVLALTLQSGTNARSPFFLAADAVSPRAFRELAVRARRCSQEHL